MRERSRFGPYAIAGSFNTIDSCDGGSVKACEFVIVVNQGEDGRYILSIRKGDKGLNRSGSMVEDDATLEPIDKDRATKALSLVKALKPYRVFDRVDSGEPFPLAVLFTEEEAAEFRKLIGQS
jgi:hypothetical protein